MEGTLFVLWILGLIIFLIGLIMWIINIIKKTNKYITWCVVLNVGNFIMVISRIINYII